ncbi:MAG: acetone carboxylase subunit gamma [Actinobacteria bacterium]|nr:acetone carboxylase subunit gamma [Actinomycetota bacterium]
MATYERTLLEALYDGRLGASELHAVMSQYKDPERFDIMLEIHQDRVPWSDRILLPLGESLYIVANAAGERVTKCSCGHEFGDYRRNWKLSALIHVRNTEESLAEIYRGLTGPDPDWMELREFFCPGCKRQLEVEAVPPAYPIVADFEPDLEAFYADWLGRPLP